MADGHATVLPLMPEFARPQQDAAATRADMSEDERKRDCERHAAKRWLAAHGAWLQACRPVLPGDDLHCCQPVCEAAAAAGMDCVRVCKPRSRKHLHEVPESRRASGAVRSTGGLPQRGKGKRSERHRFRRTAAVPLRQGRDALRGTWLEYAVERDGKRTCANIWKADRPEGVSWSTPAARSRSSARARRSKRMTAYDNEDGSPLWRVEGMEGAFISSPVPWEGGALAGSSSKGRSVALRFGPGARDQPAVAWRAADGSSYFGSPLVHRGRVYMVSKAGVAHCLRATTGETVWHARLAGQCWASAIGGGDRIYFFAVDGVTEVVSASDEFSRKAANRLTARGRLYGVAAVEDGFLLRYGRELARVGRG